MQNNVMFGIAGVVIGLFVGNMLSGPNLDELESNITGKIDEGGATAAETSAQLTALDERIAAIESAISSNAEQSGAASEALTTKIDGAVASLSDTVKSTVESAGTSNTEQLQAAFSAQLGEMGEQLTGQIGGLGDTLGDTIGGLADSLPALAAAGGAAAAVATSTGDGEAASTSETAAATEDEAKPEPEPEIVIEGVKPGQTELLADGKIRVFVSGINQDEGIARVAVNGLGLVDLGGYEEVDVEVDGKSCLLVLEAIVEGHAQIAAECAE